MRTRRQHSSSDSVSPHDTSHIPVLLHETIELLAIKKNDVVLDATLGGGGHAQEILKRLGTHGVLIGIDADGSILKRTQQKLHKNVEGKTAYFAEGNFRTLASLLETLKIRSIDEVLFDLGWNTLQLTSGRGFSFQSNDPLVMTFASLLRGDAVIASRVVNEWSEETLQSIFTGFGEERYARRISRMIVNRREQKPFETARELADAIFRAVPPAYRYGKIHPATRTFQALRIAVNDELGAIQEGFEAAWKALSKNGRIAFITFHSVEDRLVKHLMRDKVYQGTGRLLTRHPLTPSPEEAASNPRSRSAKLRVIEKQVA